VLLDEVSEMSLSAQPNSCGVLQDTNFSGGCDAYAEANIRVVAARIAIFEPRRTRHVSRDLFYRLQVFDIQFAPLRERGRYPPASARLPAGHGKSFGRPPGGLTLTRRGVLRYDWPGNVRD